MPRHNELPSSHSCSRSHTSRVRSSPPSDELPALRYSECGTTGPYNSRSYPLSVIGGNVVPSSGELAGPPSKNSVIFFTDRRRQSPEATRLPATAATTMSAVGRRVIPSQMRSDVLHRDSMARTLMLATKSFRSSSRHSHFRLTAGVEQDFRRTGRARISPHPCGGVWGSLNEPTAAPPGFQRSCRFVQMGEERARVTDFGITIAANRKFV